MRFKRRYFCVELLVSSNGSIHYQNIDAANNNKLKPSDLSQEIHRSIEKFYGDYGMATMMPSFSLIYFNSNTNLAIFRIARDLAERFRHLLTFIRRIGENGVDVTFKVVHVSGSIKKCKQFLLGYCNRRLGEIYLLTMQHKESLVGGSRKFRDDEQGDEGEDKKRRGTIEVLNNLIKSCEEDGENFY